MTKQIRRSSGYLIGKSVLIASLIFLFFSCAAKEINTTVHADYDANRGHAVAVQIYQLKSDSAFRLLPVEAFFQGEDKRLQADTVEKIPFTIIPGETKPILIKISEETRYIGAAANFNKPNKEGWREVISLDSKRPKEIWVVIQANRIMMNKK